MTRLRSCRPASCAIGLGVMLAIASTGAGAQVAAAKPERASGAAHPAVPDAATLVRRFVDEAWNAGNYAVIPQIFADDYVVRSLNATTPPVGRQSHAQMTEHVRQFREAFPDLVMTIEDVLEAGDRAYVRTRLRGTHRGPLFGLPPSGAPVDFVLMGVYRSRDGRLVGHDVLVDFMGLMQQVGALPKPPGGPGAPPPGAPPPGALPPGAPPTGSPPPGALPPGAPSGALPSGAPAVPTARLRLLEPGMRWTYRASGELRPPGATAALPMGGTITITIEMLEFRGRPVTALKFAQDLRPLGPPPGVGNAVGAPGGEAPRAGQSLFGPPVGIFWFRQDPRTRDVYFVGDNHGPAGAVRAALGDGSLFIPGEWRIGTQYDKRLEWEGGGWTRNLLSVDGTETIATGLGPRAAWRAPNRSDSAEGVTIDGADWWAPELGQPVQFDANTRLPDGAVIRIRAVLESTNVQA